MPEYGDDSRAEEIHVKAALLCVIISRTCYVQSLSLLRICFFLPEQACHPQRYLRIHLAAVVPEEGWGTLAVLVHSTPSGPCVATSLRAWLLILWDI